MIQDYFDRLVDFVLGVQRFRWTTLLVAWVLALAGWLMVAQIDSKYPVTARLFVDTNKILEPLLTGIAVQPDVKKQVALMSKTLLSRPNIERLIDKHNLDADIVDAAGRDNLVAELQDQIKIADVNGGQSLYSVSYSHREAERAKQVVDTMVEIFINSSLAEEKADNATTQDFLDKQIADYETRLVAAEQRLVDFKRQNAGSLPGESGGFYQRMETLVSQLRSAELELLEARNSRQALSRQLAQEERKINQGSQNSEVDDRIDSLQTELDELLVRYTEKHPRVSILQQSITDLKDQKRRGTNRSGRSVNLQDSVVYQTVSELLAIEESKVAQLTARTANYRTRLQQLEGTVDSIPQVEAQLTQLDRDYEAVREQHQTLLNKREAALLTRNIERDSNDVKIRLIDPSFVPARPTDPDKLLLNALVLLGAIGTGIAVGYVMSLLQPVFYNQQSLENFTDIPVLGGVSLQHRPMTRVSRAINTVNFGMLSALLPALFIWIVVMQLKGGGLYEKLKFSPASDSTVVSLTEDQ